jgi:hypothetical protein
MCNIALIGALITAAQMAFAVAIALVVAAAQSNGNIFHAGEAPGLLISATISLAIVLSTLAAATRAAAGCAAKCGGQTAKLIADINALTAALVTLAIAITIVTLFAGVPFAAGPAISGILISLAFAGILSFRLTADLGAVASCAGQAPPILTVVIVLGTLLAIGIGVVIVTSVTGGLVPLPPLPVR